MCSILLYVQIQNHVWNNYYVEISVIFYRLPFSDINYFIVLLVMYLISPKLFHEFQLLFGV